MDLSIIVPVYNMESYIDQCLSSIARSTYNIEIICINDGSDDNSLAIIQNFKEGDSRIVVIDKPNEGYGATVNRGIDLAKGTYIAILEPDDYLEGDMYSFLLSLAEQYDLPDVIKSAYWNVDEKDGKKDRCGFWGRIRPKSQPFRIKEAPFLMRYHPSIWSALYRKDFLTNNGIRFIEARGAGWVDNPFMADVLLRATNIVYTDEAFYCYRYNRAGSSTTVIGDYKTPIDRWEEMTEIFERLNVKDERLLGIHAYRAFYNLEVARHAKNFDEYEWEKAARRVLGKLDKEIIYNSPFISPGNRALYERILDSKPLKTTNAPYYRMCIKEAYWKARQNGVSYLLKRM